jgi:hypothetical protein
MILKINVVGTSHQIHRWFAPNRRDGAQLASAPPSIRPEPGYCDVLQ